MKLLSLLFLLVLIKHASGQIKIVTLDKKSLPPAIHYTGHIINAAQYIDSEGEHLIITTETGEVAVKGDTDLRKADVYAYNYSMKDNRPVLTWQMHDFSIECPVDTKARYVPNTFAITDLNKDGKAEIWLMYITGCRGDVSPGSMKIIMHESVKKYAVRGSSKVEPMEKHFYGGEYKLDEAFKLGPAAFSQYALQLWKNNIMEKGH